MARKTREESLNTKNRILDAAELVLLEKGVGQTAMADIAEAAGMSRGAVYGHFNGKIEVCVAVCDRAFSRAVEGFDLSDERPALATLRLAASLDVHLAGVYLLSLLEGIFGSMIWTTRLRGDRWRDAEAMLDAGVDTLRASPALRVAEACAARGLPRANVH